MVGTFGGSEGGAHPGGDGIVVFFLCCVAFGGGIG
jgi:hypothetical protein